MTVRLSEAGSFSWPEWTACFANQLAKKGIDDENIDESYFACWLSSLEALILEKRLLSQGLLLKRKTAWELAYKTTPHGEPVRLRSTKEE